MNATSDDVNDLRPRMVRVEHDLTDHHRRISSLEEARQKGEIADARAEERSKNMEQKLEKIDSNLSRLMWIFIGGIVMGVVAFILKGGLNIS